MEVKILLRGFAVGIIAGLLAFAFTKIYTEPIVDSAISYEEGRDAAQAKLDAAAGQPAPQAEEDEPVSRSTQRTWGVGSGLVLFGIAMGGLFAVAYAVSGRYARGLRPRELALRVAGAGFLAIFLVPFLKYPANPPAVGNAATIDDRTTLYVVMVLGASLALFGAVLLATRLRERMDRWNTNLVGGLVFAVVVGGLMLALPALGHLDANVAVSGMRDTETPLALRAPNGTIVFPGFPADELAKFRVYSLLNQLLLWSVIGLAFGWLAEKLPAHLPGRETVVKPRPRAMATA